MRRSGSGGARPRGGRGGASTGDLTRIGVRDRGARVPRSGAPYLVPVALAAAAALAAWLGWGRLAALGTSLESPETQIRNALARQDRAHLDDVYGFRAGGTAELNPVRFEDVTPSVEAGRATVVAMLSAQGRVVWRDQDARLSYLGRERFHMKPCAIARWCGEGDQFERLRGVLLALFRRHDAWQRRDLDAYQRLVAPAYRDGGEDRASLLARLARELPSATGVRVLGWQVRVDRASAEVGEDVELASGGGGARAVRHVYRLERDGERWVFAGGL